MARTIWRIVTIVVISSVTVWTIPVQGALFSENFDGNVASQWNVISGPSDFTAIFDFDYSTIGIPEAPNSVGNSDATRGLKMYANEYSVQYGGGSVSPIGLDLGSGDYVMTFDWWQNFHGPAPGGGSGTTQISYAGIMTDGVSSNVSGIVDGVFFAQTLDGGSGADWRAYSSMAPSSHQALDTTNGIPVYEASAGGTDPLARNASNPYYALAPELVPHAIPAAQTAIVAGLAPTVDHTGTSQPGITAFSWAEGKITKTGTIITFEVNDLLIATIDTADVGFVTSPTGGNNILLGHSDTNAGSSTDALFSTLTFSLFDNIVVVPEPGTLMVLCWGLPVLLRRTK